MEHPFVEPFREAIVTLPPVPVKFEVFCPSCFSRLTRVGGAAFCETKHCENFRVRYAEPVVTLRRL